MPQTFGTKIDLFFLFFLSKFLYLLANLTLFKPILSKDRYSNDMSDTILKSKLLFISLLLLCMIPLAFSDEEQTIDCSQQPSLTDAQVSKINEDDEGTFCVEIQKQIPKALDEIEKAKNGDETYKNVRNEFNKVTRQLELLEDTKKLKKEYNLVFSRLIKKDPDTALDRLEKTIQAKRLYGVNAIISSISGDLKNPETAKKFFDNEEATKDSPVNKNFLSRLLKKCETEEMRNNKGCEVIKDERVRLVVDNFGKAFNKAYECQVIKDEDKEKEKEKKKMPPRSEKTS